MPVVEQGAPGHGNLAGLRPLADGHRRLYLVPSEEERLVNPIARRFVEGRQAYWNRDAIAAQKAFDEVLASDWKAVPEHQKKMLILQVREELDDWAGAIQQDPRLGLEESFSGRLKYARVRASFPERIVEFGTEPSPVPFELYRGQLVIVLAKMQGRNVRLMVDTGFSSTFVMADFAKEAGVQITDEIIRMSDSNSSSSQARLGLLGSLEVGGLAGASSRRLRGDALVQVWLAATDAPVRS